MSPGPLPPKDGLDPARIRMPRTATGGRAARTEWPTVWDFLAGRYGIERVELERRSRAGELVLENGRVVAADTAYRPGAAVFLRRDAPDEGVPDGCDEDELVVVHRDDRLVVIDKPHGLATTPRGAFVARSVVVRARRELDQATLSPAHRLDRLTAGVLVLIRRPEHRAAYQRLFEGREVDKVYEAVAPVRPGLGLPVEVRSRITKTPGRLQAVETEGPVNAETRVELVGECGGLGRYRLRPRTGRTHQLRVHLSSLGVPILADPLYPVVRDDPDEGSDADNGDEVPLQLLARSIAFRDPLTGEEMTFTSARRLAAWEQVTGRR